MKSPFHTKKYDCYDSYLEHQCSKLDKKLKNPHGKVWLERHERNYYGNLKKLLNTIDGDKPIYNFKGKSCLCVGARGEVEVRAFLEKGCLAIGIDLNPTPRNQYVVTGDVSRIQYNENSFDIVYTNALDHFLLINRAFQNIKKVLKPNGLFLLITGTPGGAKSDDYGSTYWDSEKALEKYLRERHKFHLTASANIEKDTGGWFSHILLLTNKK